jgi:hypothetical protein
MKNHQDVGLENRNKQRKEYYEWLWVYFSLGLGWELRIVETILLPCRILQDVDIMGACRTACKGILETLPEWRPVKSLLNGEYVRDAREHITFGNERIYIKIARREESRESYKLRLSKYGSQRIVFNSIWAFYQIEVEYWGLFVSVESIMKKVKRLLR